MALPSSGVLKWSAIQTEFGGSNPVKLSEYYGRDTLPGSGLIKASDFYGTSDIITLSSWGTLSSANWSHSVTVPTATATSSFVFSGGLSLQMQAEAQGTSWSSTTRATFTATNIFSALPDISSADAGKTLSGPATFAVNVDGSANFNTVTSSVSGPVSKSLVSTSQPGYNGANVTVNFAISAANNGTLTAVTLSCGPSIVTFANTTTSLQLDSDATKFTVS